MFGFGALGRGHGRMGSNALVAAGPANPYGSYALALDFVDGAFWKEGESYGAVTEMPGYSYTDNTDNAPNITAAGFVGDFTDARLLTVGCDIGDVDFVFAVVMDLPVENAAQNLCFLRGAAGEHIGCYRSTGDVAFEVKAANVAVDSGTAPALDTDAGGICVAAVRRKSGKFTCAVRSIAGAVSVGTEGASVAMPTITAVDINHLRSAFYGSNTFRKVVVVPGTYSDPSLSGFLAAL
jgi:hypothetical protein